MVPTNTPVQKEKKTHHHIIDFVQILILVQIKMCRHTQCILKLLFHIAGANDRAGFMP